MLNSNVVSENKMKRLQKYPHKKRNWNVVSIASFIIFCLYSFTLLASLVWVFMNSLKGKYEYMESCVALPKDWLFSNYRQAFAVLKVDNATAITMLINSLWLSLSRPAIGLFTASMASYVMAKYKFPGRSLIWGIMLTTMVIPIYGTGAASLKLYKNLNVYDSPFFLITAVTGLGGNMMLISAFEGVSKSYMDAAFVDGAGHFRIFWQIMLPQVSGLLSALYIMSFVGNWNDYMTSIMYLPSYITLSTGLHIYQKMNARTLHIPLLFAGALLCMFPTMTLYIIFQDKFMNLSFGGGIKG